MKRPGGIRNSVDQRADRVVVARRRVGLADEHEPVLLVDVALVVLGQLDVVFDLLVRDDAADEQEVRPASSSSSFSSAGRRGASVMRSVSIAIGNTPVLREAERLELLPVVFRVAERHVGVADQRSSGPRGRASPAGRSPAS